MDKLLLGFTYFSAIGAGLIAGIFFAFSNFVMTALERLPKTQGIAAMQQINVTVLNPLFGFLFGGTAITCVVLAIVSLIKLSAPSAIFTLAGCLLYLIGSFLVTIMCNVPLNDVLATVDPSAQAGSNVWSLYLDRWVVWNHVRTIASLASLISFILAIRYR